VWLKELEDGHHIWIETEGNNNRKISIVEGGVRKTLQGCRENPTGGVRKTRHLPSENSSKNGSTEPPQENTSSPSITLNTKSNSPSDILDEGQPPPFEVWMEDRGYRRDSLVDSDGATSEWWEDDAGRRLKKGEVSSLRNEWKRSINIPAPSKPADGDMVFLEAVIGTIKKVLEREYGNAPVIGSESRSMILKNLVRKYDREFVKKYAQWYFVESDVDKKWRYNIPVFTSERMINQFLSQQ
jgi:hypothetical protein